MDKLRYHLMFRHWLLLFLAAPLGFASAQGQAALPDIVKPPPGINLGSTSFYDGFGRVRPGVTVLQYFRWSDNTELSNGNGQEVPGFVDPSLNIFPALTQAIAISRWHPFGGGAGFSVLVPFVDLNSSFAPNSPHKLSNNGFGIGDIIAGPSWQSKYFLCNPRGKQAGDTDAGPRPEPAPCLAFRTQFAVQIPTGSFNSARSINEGSGYWAVVPYLAATYLPRPRIEISTRLHYQYNLATSQLSNPPPIPHLVYVSGQAGQLVYGNFTSSYRFTRRLYVGANSYEVYQLSPDRTNGIKVGQARESQAYLGPGGGFDFARADTLNVNLYLKLEAHNTASGPSLQLLYIHRF
jgi:hypothetical protein